MIKIHLKQNQRTKQFFWRSVSRNGKIIADSAETYTSLTKARHGLEAFVNAIADGKYKIIEPEAPKAKTAAAKKKPKKQPKKQKPPTIDLLEAPALH